MAKKTSDKITNMKELAQACAPAIAENVDAENVDNVNAENVQAESASVINAAQIDFKKAKLRNLPKGLTFDNASIIIGAVKAIASGKPNNSDKPFTGFTVEEFRAYMQDNNYQNAAVYCIIHNYNGKNRNFQAFTYILDTPFNFVCTMHATKILPELQADRKLSGNQLFGYNDRITKAMRVASEDKKSLIGTLSFGHLVEKGFGIDCAFISRDDCNWARKNIPALYTLNEEFDVDALPTDTIKIDYRDVNALFDYVTYLHLVIKDVDKEYTQSQKDIAKTILDKIGA